MAKTSILDRLAPQPCEVEIRDILGFEDDNKTAIWSDPIMVEVVPLTWMEYQAIGAMLDNPSPPMVKRNGRTEPDLTDSRYQQEFTETNQLRDAMRIAKSLLKAGHDLPGVDLEAQARNMMSGISAGAATGLMKFLRRVALESEGRAKGDAENFHGISDTNGQDMSQDGLDDG